MPPLIITKLRPSRTKKTRTKRTSLGATGHAMPPRSIWVSAAAAAAPPRAPRFIHSPGTSPCHLPINLTPCSAPLLLAPPVAASLPCSSFSSQAHPTPTLITHHIPQAPPRRPTVDLPAPHHSPPQRCIPPGALPITSLPSPQIAALPRHIATVRALRRLALEDCFKGIICFETLNPPCLLLPCDQAPEIFGIAGHFTGSGSADDLSRFPALCKPNVGAMEVALGIANINPYKAISLDSFSYHKLQHFSFASDRQLTKTHLLTAYFLRRQRAQHSGRQAIGLHTVLVVICSANKSSFW